MVEPVYLPNLDRVAAAMRQRDTGGEPPDNGDMDARVTKLEASLQQLQLDAAVIKSNYASKEDIAKLEAKMNEGLNRVIMWVVGSIFLAQLLPAILKKFGL